MEQKTPPSKNNNPNNKNSGLPPLERLSDIIKSLTSKSFGGVHFTINLDTGKTIRIRPSDSIKRLLVVIFFTMIIAMLTPLTGGSIYQHELGRKWTEKPLVAPFDFPIQKSQKSLENEKDSVAKHTPSVFSLRRDIQKEQRESIKNYYSDLLKIVNAWKNRKNTDKLSYFSDQLQKLRPTLKVEELAELSNGDESIGALMQETLDHYDKIMQKGYLDKNHRQINHNMVALRETMSYQKIVDKNNLLDQTKLDSFIDQNLKITHQKYVQILKRVLTEYTKPNFTYDDRQTIHYEHKKQQEVSPYFGLVLKGDTIVRTGETVTVLIDLMIFSLYNEQNSRGIGNSNGGIVKFFGYFLVFFLLATVVVIFLKLNRPHFYYDKPKFYFLFLACLIILLFEIAMRVIFKDSVSLNRIDAVYFTPFCIVPILVTVFYDDRVGFLINLILSILSLVINQNHFEFFFIHFLTGSVAVFQIERLRYVTEFNTTVAYVIITNILSFMGIELINKANLNEISYTNLFILLLNGLSTLLAYPLVHILEKWSYMGLYSNLIYQSLLEKIHSHPLIIQLKEKAPGTLEHSEEVAKLGQELATAIQVNDVQVQAAAWFHDIGKLENPEFFAENQREGINPHDKLNNPEESARIIIGHILTGIHLAREYKLPEPIIDFIKTHHGTTCPYVFYRRYLEAHPTLDPEIVRKKFSYPGPKPRTKEQAVLMIADSIEASFRSRKNPTKQDIIELVNKIINSKIEETQFTDCRLTLNEVHIIRETAIHRLEVKTHKRVSYEAESKEDTLWSNLKKSSATKDKRHK